MPTIRITEKTWENLNRIAREFMDCERPGFESILKISPDDIVQKLIDDWDNTNTEDRILIDLEPEAREKARRQITEEEKKEKESKNEKKK